MTLPVTLADVVTRLGPGVLRLATGAAASADVFGVQVYDPLRPSLPHTGDVVLGVGVAPADAEILARDVQQRGAAGLIVKADAEELVTSTAPLVVVNPVVDWGRLVTLLNAALEPSDGSQSLFALCDAAAARCGGAVVLHDSRFRLIAYSSGQDLTDEVRRDTILGRSAPADVVSRLSAAGVIERLAAGDVVVLDDSGPLPGAARRAGVGVRTEAELLGHLWVQLAGDQQVVAQTLRDCAESAALVLVRRRQALADTARREDELLAGLLRSGEGSQQLTAELGVSDEAVSVLVGVLLPGSGELQRSVVGERFAMLVRGFASAYRFAMCTAVVDQTLYALRVVRPEEPAEAVGRAVGQLHAQLRRLGVGRVVVAVGDTAPVRTVAATRRDVDRLLRLLVERGDDAEFARVADHRAAVELAALRDLVLTEGEQLPDGPVRRLLEHDAERGGDLVRTLRTWFACGGDAALVAERLVLHVNTVRYRLRRMAEVAGLNLAEPDQRFLAELQLRLRAE
jgi:hypothetical protein